MWSETDRYKGLQGENKKLDEDFLSLLRDSQIKLHEGRAGQYSIKIDIIPAGKPVTVVSARNWIMMGYKQLSVVYDKPRLLYSLLRNGKSLLMNDSPQEMFLQYEAYKAAKGIVLVGGLGLGLYANMVARKKDVKKVIVVEVDKNVIDLCRPRHPKISVVHMDIWKFIRTTEYKFDYAYVDTYYGTNCMTYINTVLPMKKVFEKHHPDTPISFWGEEEMKAQYDPNYIVDNDRKMLLKIMRKKSRKGIAL